jgi:ABC-2 type transport system permease protein
MKRFLLLTKSLLLIHLRNRYTLFWNFVFPIFMMFLFNSVLGFGGDDGQGTVWMVPGLVVLNLLSFGLISSSTTMVEFRQQGILRRIQATPVSALHLIGAYLLVNLLIGLIQSATIVVFGVLVYRTPVTLQGVLMALPFVFIGILVFLAFGQVVSGTATNTGSAVVTAQIVYFSLMFISDLIMPTRFLPDFVQSVAPYVPSYAVADLVRSAFNDGAWSSALGWNLLVIAAYGGVAVFVAGRLFRWTPKA